MLALSSEEWRVSQPIRQLVLFERERCELETIEGGVGQTLPAYGDCCIRQSHEVMHHSVTSQHLYPC